MYILEGEQNLASIVNDISDLKNVKFLEVDSIPEQSDINYVLKVNVEKQEVWWEEIGNKTLETSKEEKIKLSKTKLDLYLQENPLCSNVHNNIYDYYTVTKEKQSLLTSEFTGYQTLKQAGIDAEFTWNAQGKESEVWTEQEGIALISQIRAYVKPLVSKQQELEIQIKNCNSHRELESIKIDYSNVTSSEVKAADGETVTE